MIHTDERTRGLPRRADKARNTVSAPVTRRDEPELSLPAARAFMAWALPGLDADDREDLLRLVGSAAEPAGRRAGTALPPWLAEVRCGRERASMMLTEQDALRAETDALLAAEREMFAATVVAALVAPSSGTPEKHEIETVVSRAVRTSAAVLIAAVEGTWMAGRRQCNRTEALEAFVNTMEAAPR